MNVNLRGPSLRRPSFFCMIGRNLDGTIPKDLSYIQPDEAEKTEDPDKSYMKEAGDILKIVGMVLFVLAVGVPLVLAAAGVALGIIGMLVGLAIALIKIAIVVAIIYLIIVGIRAVLR